MIKMHGNKYMEGVPDYWARHILYGHKWIETKQLKGKLRASQKRVFSKMAAVGELIYVLFDECDYDKLFKKVDNWREYI